MRPHKEGKSLSSPAMAGGQLASLRQVLPVTAHVDPSRRRLMPEGETGSAPDSALIVKNLYNSTCRPIKKCVEDPDRQLSQEDIQMASRYMRRYSATVKPLTPVRVAITNKTDNN